MGVFWLNAMRRTRFGTWAQHSLALRAPTEATEEGAPVWTLPLCHSLPTSWRLIPVELGRDPSWSRDDWHRGGVGARWDQTDPRGRSQGKGAGKASSPWHSSARSSQSLAWSRNSRRVPAGRARGMLHTPHAGGQGWVCCSTATLPPRSSKREPDSPNADAVTENELSPEIF